MKELLNVVAVLLLLLCVWFLSDPVGLDQKVADFNTASGLTVQGR